eukprot:TRINITY_DN914_c1_g1_i5.p1 TRINITY_DN914_c1_g1~~TRINITY_DN914_c1_g1_i5.p1  ORF type:complete len:1132 (+),score=352.25 TRINITY_DN914_c1_g1_i5:165-3560(+)
MSASKLDPVKSGAIYRVVPGSKEYLAMTSLLPRQSSSDSQRRSVSERFLALVQASPMPRVLRQAHEIGVSSAPFLAPATLWDAVQPPARPLRSPSSLDTIVEQLPNPGSAARGHNTVPAYQRQVMMASPQSTPAAAPRQWPHSCEQPQRHGQQQHVPAAAHDGAADVAAAQPRAAAAEQWDFATPQQPVRAQLQAGADACLDVAAAATSAASAAHAIAAAPSPLPVEPEQEWEAGAAGGESGGGDTVDDRVLYPEGTAVRRQFVEGWFNGQVVLRHAVNSENAASTTQQQQRRVLWRVLYTDGDSEDLHLEDMHEMVANYAAWAAATRPPLLEPKVEADDAADAYTQAAAAAAAAAAALAAPATDAPMPAAGAGSAVASAAAAALSPPAAAAAGTQEVVLRDWCITMSPLPRSVGSSSVRNLQSSGVAQPKYYIHGFVDAGSSSSSESAAAAMDDTSGVEAYSSSNSRSSAPIQAQLEARVDQHTVVTVGGARYRVRGAPSDAGAAALPPPHGALFAVRGGVPMQWRRAVSRAYERAAAAATAEAAASSEGQQGGGGDCAGDVQLPTGTIAGRLRNKAGSSTPASTSQASKAAVQSTVSRKPGADATMPSAHGSATKKKPAAGKASAAAPPSAAADKQASASKVSRKGGAVATKANPARSSSGLAALVAVKPEPQEVAALGALPAALSTSRSSGAGRKSAAKAAAAAAAAAPASHCSAASRKAAAKAPKSQKQRLSAAAETPVAASKKPSKKGSSHAKGGGRSTGHAAGGGGGGINSGGGGGDESGVKVTRTRSGRKRVPVLEWWRSQRLSVGQDSSAELLSPTPMKPSLTSSTGKRRRSAAAPAVKQEPQESTSKRRKGVQGDEWTEQQEALLQQAQLRTDPGHANFWVHVAKGVPGKSASQCSQRWFAQVEEHNDGAGGTSKGNQAGAKRKRGKSAAATPSAKEKPAASAVKTAQGAPKGGKRGQTRAAAIASYLSSQAGHMDDVFQDSGGAQGKKKRKLSVPGIVSLPPNTLGATVPTPKVQGKTGKAGKSPASARQSQAGGNVSKSYMVAVSKRMRKQPPPKAGAIMVKAKRPKAAKAVTTTTAAGAGYKLKGMVSSGGAVRLEEQAASSSEYDCFANESGSESDTE